MLHGVCHSLWNSFRFGFDGELIRSLVGELDWTWSDAGQVHHLSLERRKQKKMTFKFGNQTADHELTGVALGFRLVALGAEPSKADEEIATEATLLC